eukprot:scaffold2.g7336.t1
MGVGGFQSWLRRRYPEAFTSLELPGQPVDVVYIDLASTLHQVIRRSRTRVYFHAQLHRRLDEILTAVQPRQGVVLALDGPAPLAKLLEQRRRRRREAARAAFRNGLHAAPGGAGGVPHAVPAATATARGAEDARGAAGGADSDSGDEARGGPPPEPPRRPLPDLLSPLMLTTGTREMLEVHQSLAYYILRCLANPATAHLRFELSDSTVKGEGELKILSRILHQAPHSAAALPLDPAAAGGTEPGGDAGPAEDGAAEGAGGEAGAGAAPGVGGAGAAAHLVLGGDSDLLLMSLVAGRRGVLVSDDSQDLGAIVAAAQGGAPAGVGTYGGYATSYRELWRARWGERARGAAAADGDEGGEGGEDARRPPALRAFSRDAVEAAWREQHLGPDASPQDATNLALDLALLSIMSSGNDYLPAVHGLTLSNKYRPGVWDLYLSMRESKDWRGQWLVHRSCGCAPGGAAAGAAAQAEQDAEGEGGRRGGSGGGAAAVPARRVLGPSCPVVSINRQMLAALLQRYHDQRYLSPPPGVVGEAAGATAADGAADTAGAAAAAAAAAAPAPAPAGGAVCEPWDDWPSSPAAAAAAAAAAGVGPPAGAGASTTDEEGGGPRRKWMTRRGLPPDTPEYLKGLEWVLHMYATGSCSDYRWSYDYASPGLPELVAALTGGHAVGREFDGLRRELAELQQQLAEATALDADAPQEAAEQLLRAIEHSEATQARLREVLADLSRSQAEHLVEQHPYKPFPIAELEAAVAAVPLDRYTGREQRLIQFGREFVFFAQEGGSSADGGGSGGGGSASGSEAGGAGAAGAAAAPGAGGAVRSAEAAGAAATLAGSGVGGEGAGPVPLAAVLRAGGGGRFEPWVHEALLFADQYPRIADRTLIQRAASRLRREVLPLRPYMQPFVPPRATPRAAPRAGAPAAPRAAGTGLRVLGNFGCQVQQARHAHAAAPPAPLVLRGGRSSGGGLCGGGGASVLPPARPAPIGPGPLVHAALRLWPRVRGVIMRL